MVSFNLLLLHLSLTIISEASAVTYAVPVSVPNGAVALDPAPLGVS
jgi:hypothetical protein